jgi:hypothetical protein
MITHEQVMRAKTDKDEYNKLFNYFFSGMILEAFLINQGIETQHERDELRQTLFGEFDKRLQRFKPEKHIPFEKLVWYQFKLHVLYYFQKEAKRQAKGIENYGSEIEIPSSDLRNPYIEIDLDMDLEVVAKKLDDQTRFIFELMAKGYERKDLPSLDIPVKWWDKARPIIQSVVLQTGIL